MPPKRPANSDALGSPSVSKLLKTKHSNTGDFSSSVKRKLATSTRTGQACDRCKVRKIRCDGRAGGCSPCIQNNEPCKTTDRITGRATTRGHTEALEAENTYLRQTIANLQDQLKELGGEVKNLDVEGAIVPSADKDFWPQSTESEDATGWSDQQPSPTSANRNFFERHSLQNTTTDGIESTVFGTTSSLEEGCTGDNYLGVSSAESQLSPIKGTSLSFFGAELDLSDFVPPHSDDNSSPLSYQHFLEVAFNKTQDVERLPFPPCDSAKNFATWYFSSLNPYTPILCRTAFMTLLWRIYNEPNFKPSSAQTVMVHLMLASIKYQISIRNSNPLCMDESHKHYRYALTFFSDLLINHSLEDVQALTLLCTHLRCFPKPGAAWIVTHIAFAIAVELGLHRSVKSLSESQTKMDLMEIELRKRVFWCLYALLVGLSGKLGRAMPIRIEDIDVEFPESLDDSMPPRIDRQKCPFQVGIESSKAAVVFGQMYRTVYAVRQPPQLYERTVKRLEIEIQLWRDQIPAHLADASQADAENRIFARYLHFWEQELRLLVHHPAVCRSTNPKFISSNLDECLDASSKMLYTVNELRKMKSLDVPWMTVTVYLAAIFTTLYIHSHRKESITAAGMSKLRNEMELWEVIMGEVGQMLGTGARLQAAVRNIVKQSMEKLNEFLLKKNAPVVHNAPNKFPQRTSIAQSSSFEDNEGVGSQFASTSNGTHKPGQKSAGYITHTEQPITQNPGNYQLNAQQSNFAFPEATSNSINPFDQSAKTESFDHKQYTLTNTGMEGPEASTVVAPETTATNPTTNAGSTSFAYSANPATQTPTQAFTPALDSNHNASWRQWTQSMVANIITQGIPQQANYMNPTPALMNFGGPRESGAAHVQPENTMVHHSQGSESQLWPNIVYMLGQGREI